MQYARPFTTRARPIVTIGRAASGCGCSGTAGVGAFELPPIDWKQIGLGLVVGVGLGYVLFGSR